MGFAFRVGLTISGLDLSAFWGGTGIRTTRGLLVARECLAPGLGKVRGYRRVRYFRVFG